MKKIVVQLTDGLPIKARKSGRFVLVKDMNGNVVAGVSIGKRAVRLDLKEELSGDAELLAEAEALSFTGHSDYWRGGGVRVTEHNVEGLHAVLEVLVDGRRGAPQVISTRSHDEVKVLAAAEEEGLLDDEFHEELREMLVRRLKREDVIEKLNRVRNVNFDDILG